MESEVTLHAKLERLHVIATAPELLSTINKSKLIPLLNQLIQHDNVDVSCKVVETVHELVDMDDTDAQEMRMLIDALIKAEVPSLLLSHLDRLDESDDDQAACINATLSIIETLLGGMPECSTVIAECGWMRWLLHRLKPRPFHANKLFSSELLAVILQENETNQALVESFQGVLTLLTAAAQYKRREPVGMEEGELVENIFDCIVYVLAHEANHLPFLRAEGVELMLLIIKEHKYAHRGALRVLATSLSAGAVNCERFVDSAGFKTFFPILGVSPPAPPTFARGVGERAAFKYMHDENCATILSALFKNLVDTRRLRLLGKFAEDDYAKLNRLLDMHAFYNERVNSSEEFALGHIPTDSEESVDIDEVSYSARLEAGLTTLQGVDISICFITAAGHKGLRRCVLEGLYFRGSSLLDAWAVAEEATLDEAKLDSRQRLLVDEMKSQIRSLTQHFGPTSSAESEPGAPGAERIVCDKSKGSGYHQ